MRLRKWDFCFNGHNRQGVQGNNPDPNEIENSCLFASFSVTDFRDFFFFFAFWDFPGASDSKEPTCNVGDLGSIPGSGRSPGEGNGNPLQEFFLWNPKDRGPWWPKVHGVTKSWTWLRDSLLLSNLLQIEYPFHSQLNFYSLHVMEFMLRMMRRQSKRIMVAIIKMRI